MSDEANVGYPRVTVEIATIFGTVNVVTVAAPDGTNEDAVAKALDAAARAVRENGLPKAGDVWAVPPPQ